MNLLSVIASSRRRVAAPPSGGISVRTGMVAEYLFQGSGADTAGEYDGTTRAANTQWTSEGLYFDDAESSLIGFTSSPLPTFSAITLAIAFKPITKSNGINFGYLGQINGNGSTHGNLQFGSVINNAGANWREPGQTDRGVLVNVAINKWHRLIASNTHSNRNIWIDGTLIATIPWGGANLVGGGNLTFAHYGSAPGRHWHGVVAVCALWDINLGTTFDGDILQVHEDLRSILIARGVSPSDIL